MKYVLSMTIVLVILSGCSKTWQGVKQDSSTAWENTKDVSSKAYKSTKNAVHEATAN